MTAPFPSGKPASGTRLNLDNFIEEVAEIAPRRATPITAQSELVADLGFDSLAFGRLVLYLYENYGIAGLSTEALQSEENLTVERFFTNCVLNVLGFDARTVT